MNLNNFIIRPHRQLVETYAKLESWNALPTEQISELTNRVAGLPHELPSEDEETKQFDLLMLRLQLARLRSEKIFPRLSKQLRDIAALLEEKDSIPMVREQMELIQEIQTDAWWQDVTIPMLEGARKRLRALVKLIEKTQRKPIYTDFIDEMGAEVEIEIQGFGNGNEFERFRAKARQFLQAHADHITIHKLRFNQSLTGSDLSELERMLSEAAIGTDKDLEHAKTAFGLGVFIRSLVGLDREAAKQAFSKFLSATTASANQIEFINLIIDYLTHHGIMEPRLLYESPFTDLNSSGLDGVFSSEQVDELLSVLDDIRAAAAA